MSQETPRTAASRGQAEPSSLQPLVVILHAAADTESAKTLRKHLTPLVRQGAFRLWSLDDVQPGQERLPAIQQKLDAATVVVLVVTADLLDENEADRWLRQVLRTKPAEALVPVLTRPVHLGGSPLDGRSLLPANRRPISLWTDREQAWAEVARAVGQVVRNLQNREGTANQGSPAPNSYTEQTPPRPTDPERPPTPPAPVRPLPRSLLEAVRRRRLIPFAGAGVSVAVEDRDASPRTALFPTWIQLLSRAVEEIEAEGAQYAAQLVRGHLHNERGADLYAAAAEAKRALGPLWFRFLKKQLDLPRERAAPESLELARLLWQLGSSLVVTTNYDRVPRWACPRADDLVDLRIQAAAEQTALLSGDSTAPTLWYLHGSIDDVTNIILTPDGYRRLYPERDQQGMAHQAALHTLRTLLGTRTLLFVGWSFSDLHLGDQLAWVNEVFAGTAGPHYMLVRQAQLQQMQARIGQLPLVLVPFADFGEPLLDLLRQLAAHAEGAG